MRSLSLYFPHGSAGLHSIGFWLLPWWSYSQCVFVESNFFNTGCLNTPGILRQVWWNSTFSLGLWSGCLHKMKPTRGRKGTFVFVGTSTVEGFELLKTLRRYHFRKFLIIRKVYGKSFSRFVWYSGSTHWLSLCG